MGFVENVNKLSLLNPDALNGLYDKREILDSLFADKATLDSLFADKATLDSLFADKAILDSLFADKATLDSLFADKATLDSLFADKATLDRLYTSISHIDRVFTSIDNIDSLVLNTTNIDTVANSISSIITTANSIEAIQNVNADIIKGKGTNSSTDSAILNALDNALIASEKASSIFDSAEQIDTNKTDIANHTSDLDNPHVVTKAQVGLSNVDNTSDLDKPISTATQAELNIKANADVVYTKVELAGAIGNINSPLLDLPLNNSLAMKQGVGSVTFSRSTSATYIDRYGVLQTADIDEPRFEKDGLLIEGASTNLKLHSKIDAFYTKGCDIDDDSIASPTGGMTGSTITCNEDGSVYLYRLEESEQDQVYTASYFVKNGNTDGLFNIAMHANSFGSSLRVFFDLNTCQITSTTNSSITGTITELADGWFRLSATATATEDNTDSATYLDLLYTTNALAVDDYFYVWGAQLEKLPFASSYIPTTDSAVTRGVDLCTASAYNNVPDFSKGFSFVQDFVYGGTAITATVTQFSTVRSDVLNRECLFFRVLNASSDITVAIANTAGAGVGGVLIHNATIGTKYRLAVVLDDAGMRGYVDGVLIFTQSSITQSDVLAYANDRIFKFNGWGNSSNPAPVGKIYSTNMRWYDRALTEQEVRLA